MVVLRPMPACVRVRCKSRIWPALPLLGSSGLKDSRKNTSAAHAVGVPMPSINTKILADVPIYFPPSPNKRLSQRCCSPGRQDRVEPADERDAGGHGAGALPELVRRFRPRPRQTRRPQAHPASDPATVELLFPKEFEHSEPRSRSQRIGVWARVGGGVVTNRGNGIYRLANQHGTTSCLTVFP